MTTNIFLALEILDRCFTFACISAVFHPFGVCRSSSNWLDLFRNSMTLVFFQYDYASQRTSANQKALHSEIRCGLSFFSPFNPLDCFEKNYWHCAQGYEDLEGKGYSLRLQVTGFISRYSHFQCHCIFFQ